MRLKRPRHWADVVKVGAVLQLTVDELDGLLAAAGHEGVAVWRVVRPDLFGAWQPLASPPPFQVPPERPFFTGRAVVVARLSRFLRREAPGAVVCLMGMAGVGKTSLATHMAYRLRDHFADGVLWLPLARTDVMSALQGLASAYEVDVSCYSDLETRSSQVRQLLAGKQALLVLDNVSSDGEVRPLLPPTSRCAVIVTSRRRDLVVADGALRLDLSPFDEEKGESLAFWERVLGRERVAREGAMLGALAQVLGHLPLALDIMAQRLKHEPGWTAAGLLARLAEDGEGLTLADRLGEPELRSRLLGNLGLVACHLGNHAEAAAYFRRGLALAEGSGLTVQICRQQANLGYVCSQRGDYAQADVHYEEALLLARSLGFPEDLCVISNQMGDVCLARHRLQVAVGYFEEAQAVAAEANLPREMAAYIFS